MRKSRIWGFALMLTLAAIFSACEKEPFEEVKSKSNVTVDDQQNSEQGTQAVVLNAIDANIAANVSVFVDGNELISGLGLGEVSEVLNIPLTVGADVNLEVFSENGILLLETDLNLLDQDLVNLVLHVGENGLPELDLLEIDLQELLANAPILGDALGIDNLSLENLFALNILNLSDLDVNNLLLELDFINGNGDLVAGLLELPQNVLSETILGNDNILDGLNLLGSDLPLLGVLEELTGGNSPLEVLNLGDLLAVTNFLGDPVSLLENPSVLFDVLEGILDKVLGILFGNDNDNPLSVIQGGQLDEVLKMLPGHQYTLVILGEEGALQYLLIDNNLLKLLNQ